MSLELNSNGVILNPKGFMKEVKAQRKIYIDCLIYLTWKYVRKFFK